MDIPLQAQNLWIVEEKSKKELWHSSSTLSEDHEATPYSVHPSR